MAKKKFSDLPATTSIGASDLLATSQVDADAQSGYTSKKITGGNVARSINAGIEYPTDLETEDKTIIGAINEINSKALAIDSASGDIASFDTAISAPLVSLSTTIVAKGGGGTPSTPIPIVGYSDVNLTRCGKNFWNVGIQEGYIYNGRYYPSSNYWCTDTNIAVLPNTTYTLQGASASDGQICFYDKDNVFIPNSAISARIGTFTTPNNAYFISVYNSISTLDEPKQLELGSQATSYEPYNGQTITLALGQTVYGGTLDVTRGKLTVTKNYKDTFVRGSLDSSGKLYYVGEASDGKSYGSQTVADILCNALPVDTLEGLRLSQTKGICFFNKGFYVGGYVGDEAALDTLLQTLEVVYPLATPFTLDLSSSDMLDAVVGKNNVFSDCGVTSLTFIDKMQHYIDKKIAELQALILQ